MYALGYSLAGWLGYACYFMKADDSAAQFSWRFPLAFQIFFPIVVLAGSRLIPYSPRWLLSKGRRQEALDIVKRLHRTPSDPEDTHARQEFWLMEKQYEMDASMSFGTFELFKTPANRKRALMAFILMWGDQFLGKKSLHTPFQRRMTIDHITDPSFAPAHDRYLRYDQLVSFCPSKPPF